MPSDYTGATTWYFCLGQDGVWYRFPKSLYHTIDEYSRPSEQDPRPPPNQQTWYEKIRPAWKRDGEGLLVLSATVYLKHKWPVWAHARNGANDAYALTPGQRGTPLSPVQESDLRRFAWKVREEAIEKGGELSIDEEETIRIHLPRFTERKYLLPAEERMASLLARIHNRSS